MRDTGGKHITDMFLYKNHAIPVLEVTAIDCILEATHCLTAAIEDIQEAALDGLQAIKSLHHILLGKKFKGKTKSPSTSLHDSIPQLVRAPH
jgi:hypothetical protein